MAAAKKQENAPEAPAKEAKTDEKATKVKLVKMENESGLVADVHPEEVRNYAKGGYVEVKK